MSYCRFTDADVYVYADANGGWTTHVAARRNKAGKCPIRYDFSSEEAIVAFVEAREAWFSAHTEFEDIVAPSAGQTFNDPTPGACADRLESLRAEGLDVPQYAIDELRSEMDGSS